MRGELEVDWIIAVRRLIFSVYHAGVHTHTGMYGVYIAMAIPTIYSFNQSTKYTDLTLRF